MHLRQPDFALQSQNIVTDHGIRAAAILVKDGKILDLVAPAEIPAACPIEHAGALAVLPGIVDPHVHINAPGQAGWNGFETTTRIAAAGGVTMLVDMPLNGLSATTKVHAFKQKCQAAKGKIWVDCGFYGGVVPHNVQQLEPLISEGVLGLKAYLIDPQHGDFPNIDEADLRNALPVLAKHHIPLLVHAEMNSEKSSAGKNVAQKTGGYKQFLASRPRSWENRAVHRLIRLAKETTAHIHIVHLSSTDTIPALREARLAGVPLTIETCPHFLFFAAEEIDDVARFQCTPPIRERENREKLWEALESGVIDFISSGHAFAPRRQNQQAANDFQLAHGGIPSLQFSLSVVWTAARQRGFSLRQVADWLCAQPAAFIGIADKKGKIAPGYDADLVVFDAEKSFRVSRSMILQDDQTSPYEGQTLQGRVVKTYLRGKKIYDQGRFVEQAIGQIVQKNGR